MGEKIQKALKLQFDKRLRLEFLGARINFKESDNTTSVNNTETIKAGEDMSAGTGIKKIRGKQKKSNSPQSPKKQANNLPQNRLIPDE
jgi:hypothetical protein